MARDPLASPDDAGDVPAREDVPDGAIMLTRNHGAIYRSRHRFWEAGTVLTDPEDVALAIRTGAAFVR